MRITKFTVNEKGQRPIDCVEFNNGKKDESCMLDYLKNDKLYKCVMYDGKICPNYHAGLSEEEMKKANEDLYNRCEWYRQLCDLN